MNIYLCYALIVFIALMAAVKVAFQNDFVRKFSKSLSDTTLYLSFAFFFIAVIMLFLVDYTNLPEWQTIVMGVAFGLSTALGQVAYSYAMKNGPVSLTVLITCFALVIPTGAGLIFWGESINIYQGIGLTMLAFSMVFILYKPSDKKAAQPQVTQSEEPAEQPLQEVATASAEKPKRMKKPLLWLLFTLTTFLTFGIGNTLQSWHQRIPEIRPELNWFVFISYASAGCFSLLSIPISREKITFKLNRRVIIDIVCGAIALGLHNYIRPLLSNYVDNSILHPMANICNILFITLFGVILFKDKISKLQWVGIGTGIVSIVLLCI